MKVVFLSIEILDNWKAIIIHFFILPLLRTLMFVLLNFTITGQYNLTVIATSIVLSGSLTALSHITSSFVNDTMRGIDRELARKNPLSLYYWGSKLLVIFLFSFLLIISNLMILGFLGLPTALMIRSLFISPLLISYGLIIGATASILGWGRPNPYGFSNFISEAALILAGIIAPYQQFPPLFRLLTCTLPYAQTMDVLFNPASVGALLMDALIAFVWLCIGIGVYSYKVHRIDQLERRTMI